MQPTQNGGSTSTQNTQPATPYLFDYQPEDGGILDAWLEHHGETWLYAAGFEEWYQWTGAYWRVDSSYAVLSEIQELIDNLNQQARKLPTHNPHRRSYITATKRTKARIASVEGMARNKRYVKADDLDSAELLNLQNGTLNLRTKVLQPHDPDDRLTYCLPYAYDSAATAPNWQKLLESLDPEIVCFLQEFAGYSLTPDTRHEIAVWLYGPPGGGKSTILRGFQTMLGPRAGILGLADIERSQFALSNLPGKTLVIATEQPSQFLASTHVLNAIISGETIMIDRKYRDPVELTSRAKIAWAMNDFPRVSDANNGIFRRVKVIEFPLVPEDERQPELKELIAEEGSGILNWALEGLERLQVRNRFDIPDSVAQATKEFIRQNDIPANFVEECCNVGPLLSVQSSDLYKAYKEWCFETGHKPQSTTSIASDWRRLGFKRRRTSAGSIWEGVDLTVTARSHYGTLYP